MSDLTPSIIELASQIQSKTKVIHDHLQQNKLPPFSFAPDAFPFFPGTGTQGVDPFPAPDQKVLDARRDVRQACETLLQLVTTPADHLFYYLCQHYSSACLQYIYHFRLADVVPANGEMISFAEVASKAGVDESQCTRILRMAMTHNYFHEPRPGWVGHTSGSKLLLVPHVRDLVGYIMEEGFLGAPRISETAEKFRGGQERNQAPWNVGQGVDLPIFEFFETEPARMTRFFGCMDAMGSEEGYNIKHLVNGFDWKGLGKGTVVDVGGSTGHCSFAIAEVAPELRFVVQDLEKVVEAVKERTKDQENERVSFETHSFFEPQPVKDADVYLLRFIAHDYPNKYAAKILANLIPAMGPKSKIVLMDVIMPAPHAVSKSEERRMRFVDMEMMMTFNASERDLDGWKALFAQVDQRLTLHSVVTPPGSAHSIMELVLEA